MKKRLLVAAVAGGLLAGGANLAVAQGPDVTGPALYGLCTAYYNGQGGTNGNKNNAPPFAALVAEYGDDLQQVCSEVRPSNGQGKGSGNSNAPRPVEPPE